MVLLGQQTGLVRHRGPSRGKSTVTLTAIVALAVALAAVLVGQYNDRPPWGDDVAYEGGYLLATRIRQADVSGERTKELLSGGCARMLAEGFGGRRATHDPGLWVAGCLDGATGHISAKQGLFH
ncbi:MULTISPECIES: hypothetical protein [unclassified Streptomyces]|uniref:hypothetical protein n=1 Tax=unclassified Streptomyces TaxID=2593676 RepID=UPI00340198EC